MSESHPKTVLVLGGIRSGKSEFAESLVTGDGDVRYIATAAADGTDTGWSARIAAHRQRRPDTWVTEEVGGRPDRLIELVAGAEAGRTLLVDDLGGWVAALLADGDGDDVERAVADLAAAVAVSPARVVLVSPEVGLSVVPATEIGARFADVVGSANRTVAAACGSVALVVAGEPVWLRSSPTTGPGAAPGVATAGFPAAGTAPAAEERAAARPSAVADTAAMVVPARAASTRARKRGSVAAQVDADTDELVEISPGMGTPLPDDEAANAAAELLGRLPLLDAGLGRLAPAVTFLAGALGLRPPRPLSSVRVIAIEGSHGGALGTGDDEEAWAARDAAARAGDGVLARLASAVPEVTVEILAAGHAAPIEDGDAATADQTARALSRGWKRAQAAADRGDEAIVLAAGGPGMNAAAAAVVTAITRGEIASVLGRVWRLDGTIDDAAWMVRCVTIRDTLRRLRDRVPDGPTVLTAVGGPSIATATGVLLGAADRRLPVVIDGPVGVAAAIAARDYGPQVRLWCLLMDAGTDPTVHTGADRLGIAPLLDVGLGLGEGGGALALLPTLQAALAVAALEPAP